VPGGPRSNRVLDVLMCERRADCIDSYRAFQVVAESGRASLLYLLAGSIVSLVQGLRSYMHWQESNMTHCSPCSATAACSTSVV